MVGPADTTLILTLANLPEHPESAPINMLIQVAGTPLYGTKNLMYLSSCAPSPLPGSPCRDQSSACRLGVNK